MLQFRDLGASCFVLRFRVLRFRIVMDEAKANVDYETDRVIQETIRAKFKQCTVITIAHRLNTIKDCDRVLVLDDAGILGFDRPKNLLEKESYLF